MNKSLPHRFHNTLVKSCLDFFIKQEGILYVIVTHQAVYILLNLFYVNEPIPRLILNEQILRKHM